VTNKPEGTPNDGTWPEQNEVNAWFENHSFELKDRVSKYRIEIQKQLDKQTQQIARLQECLNKADDFISDAITGGGYDSNLWALYKQKRDKVIPDAKSALGSNRRGEG